MHNQWAPYMASTDTQWQRPTAWVGGHAQPVGALHGQHNGNVIQRGWGACTPAGVRLKAICVHAW